MLFPDLPKAYAIVGTNQKNSWQTNILSILERTNKHGEKSYSYLTKECSAESISNSSIFNLKLRYVFQVLKTWDGVFCIRTGKHVRKEERHFHSSDLDVDVKCPFSPIKVLRVDELIKDLQSCDKQVASNTFLKVFFKKCGFEYAVYCPCHYINYPNDNFPESGNYIQPIMGLVLLEWIFQCRIYSM